MYMIDMDDVQYTPVQKHCSRFTDQTLWKYLQCDWRGAAFKSHPKAMFLCFEWLNTLGRRSMNKKAPGGPWQSNVGALYLPEHKSSPHVQNECWKESEALSGRSGMSWGLWENLTTQNTKHTHYGTISVLLLSVCRIWNPDFGDFTPQWHQFVFALASVHTKPAKYDIDYMWKHNVFTATFWGIIKRISMRTEIPKSSLFDPYEIPVITFEKLHFPS